MRWLSNENADVDEIVDKVSTFLNVVDSIKENNDLKSLELNFSITTIGVIALMIIKLLPIISFVGYRLYRIFIYVRKYLKRRKDKQYVQDKFEALYKSNKKNTDEEE
jgi:hypothetical protein